MEKSITLRFYDLTRTDAAKPSFESILQKIEPMPLKDRERTVGANDILVRLEDYAADGDELAGQLIRAQSGNRPGRMMPTGTAALPFSEPLGHGVAFRYRKADGLLGIQFDPRVLSPSRFIEYFYAIEPTSEFRLLPRMREDAWDRFDSLPLRKLEVAVAGHPNVTANASPESQAAWAALSDLGDKYKAHTVRIELSMGHKSGSLPEDVKALARDVFARFTAGSEDVRSLRGVVETGEGLPNDDIDLMGTLFDVKVDLSFPDDDPAKFYKLRRDILKTSLANL
jgi:hypothetical protein